jgi:hypothetical protein
MASEKKRRKDARQAHKQRLPKAGPFRHRDGDRRRRAEMAAAVKQALAAKKALQQIGLPLPPEGPPAEDG